MHAIPKSRIEAGWSAHTLYHLMRIKKLAEKDEYSRNSLSWTRIIRERIEKRIYWVRWSRNLEKQLGLKTLWSRKGLTGATG
jgi:hypothetical protein